MTLLWNLKERLAWSVNVIVSLRLITTEVLHMICNPLLLAKDINKCTGHLLYLHVITALGKGAISCY